MSERTIFLNALEIPDPVARRAYVDQECHENADLRRQVDALLMAHERAGEFLEHPAAAPHPAFVRTQAETGGSSSVGHGHGHDPGVAVDPDDLKFLGPSPRPDALGRVAHYDVLAVLGRGAFGTVFKAVDTGLDRVVALKILSPELAASGPARRRFIREAKAAASVRHEHVVDIHAVGEEPIPHLVMECILGQTLQQKLDRVGVLPVIEILRIGYQIASGLSAAHALGLIHRDIKPANILLENGVERVKITDFGLARAGDDASLTQSGIVCGTPMYMSPEQAQADQIDGRADLFSLGSTLYAMCTGRPPFRATTTMAVLKRVVEETPRPIREINPEIPEWLCEIIDKLLAKKPEDRFASAREVAALFGQHLAHLQHPKTAPRPAAVGLPRGKSGAQAGSWTRRAAGLWTVLLGAGVVLAADLAFRYLKARAIRQSPQDASNSLLAVMVIGAVVALLVSWLLRSPKTRRALTSLAVGSLLIAGAEGMRWIRLSESPRGRFPTAADVEAKLVRELEAAPAVSGDGWANLLSYSTRGDFDGAPAGVHYQKGLLKVSAADDAKDINIELNRYGFRNGTLRMEAVCRRSAPSCAISLGMSHGDGTPLRVSAALQTRQADGQTEAQLWQTDDQAGRTSLAHKAVDPISLGRHVLLELTVDRGAVVAQIDGVELNHPRALSPDRDVVPCLAISGSDWDITRWELTTADKPIPIDSLNWGRFVNPTDLASLERAYDYSVMEVPGTRPFQLSALPGQNVDAPRLVQDVEGDFELSVAIPPFDRPAPGTDLESGGKKSDRGAGIVLWQDATRFLRFERSGRGEERDGAPMLQAEWFRSGGKQEGRDGWLPTAPDGPTHLKVHRMGPYVRLYWSLDGLDWTEWGAVTNAELGPKLQIGLFVRNSTRSPLKVRFDRFRVRATELPDPSLAILPFDARRAAAWQEETAKAAGVPVERTNSIGMTLRLIPPGEFPMGLSIDEINDVLKRPHQAGLDRGLLVFMTDSSGPQHKVRLTRPYYVGTTEVTVGQFRKFLEETKFEPANIPQAEADQPNWVKPASDELDRQPAIHVTWHEARKFCLWLSEKEGLEYTLPTDAQWEFACRAGSLERWPHGDDRSELPQYAWFSLGYHDAPHAVGEKKPNAFGLHDMLGNAHEWALDWHQQSFYTESPIIDPVCTKPGVGRVCRGGWWWDTADLIRSGSRSYNVPDVRYPGCGFRVAIVGNLKSDQKAE